MECMHEESFDLVLMDLHMPGISMASRLRATSRSSCHHDFQSSRSHRAKVVPRTAEAVRDGYIAKPLSLAHLVEALRKLDRHPSLAPSLLTSVAASSHQCP